MTRFILPLGLFMALALTLGMGLRHQSELSDPAAVPSPLVGRQLPGFDVPVLTSAQAGETHFQPGDLRGQVWLLNVWASWCASCVSEHPVLVAQARAHGLTVVGFNYQDGAEPARQWLSRHGNPFRLTFADPSGRLGLDLGIVAVPETFLIDQQGRIRHKFTGPLTEGDWRTTLLPKLRELQGV